MAKVVFTGAVQPLADALKTIYQQKRYTDVVFVVRGGERLHAHSIILASRSKYFEKLFFGNFKTAQQPEIVLDLPAKPLGLVLEYLYTDRLELRPEEVIKDTLLIELLGILQEFQTLGPVQELSSFLAETINGSNVHVLQEAAKLYDLAGLLEECELFLSEHALDVLRAPEFLKLPKEKLIELIKSDNFYAPESEIFEAVLAWHEANPAAKIQSIVDYVRFTLMENSYLYNFVAEKKVLKPTRLINILKTIYTGVGREKKRNSLCTKPTTVVNILKAIDTVEDRDMKREFLSRNTAEKLPDLMYAKRINCEEIFKKSAIESIAGNATVDLNRVCTFNYICYSLNGVKTSHYNLPSIYYRENNPDWTPLVPQIQAQSTYLTHEMPFQAVRAQYIRFCGITKQVSLQNLEIFNVSHLKRMCNVALEKYGATLKTGQPINNHKLLSEEAHTSGSMAYTKALRQPGCSYCVAIEFGRIFHICKIKIELNSPTKENIFLYDSNGNRCVRKAFSSSGTQNSYFLDVNKYISEVVIVGDIELKTIECLATKLYQKLHV